MSTAELADGVVGVAVTHLYLHALDELGVLVQTEHVAQVLHGRLHARFALDGSVIEFSAQPSDVALVSEDVFDFALVAQLLELRHGHFLLRSLGQRRQ